MTGTIQPGILHRALGFENRENGLAARLLLAYPPRKPKRWTEAEIDESIQNETACVIDWLYELRPAMDDDGNPRPIIISLEEQAKQHWIKFYNDHNRDQSEQSGDIAAAFSKLEECAARLALVIHYVRAAVDAVDNTGLVDIETMKSAITLVEWFKRETLRVYGLLESTEDQRQQNKLVEFIRKRGGKVTVRDTQNGCRWLKTVDEAEAALGELEYLELGYWQERPSGKKGGHPTRDFVLYAVSTSTEPRQPLGK